MNPIDVRHMRRALALAEKGRGRVHPNPTVGCVVARGARVLGEGHHARFGGPHAETMALRRAGLKAKGATVYVTLEPCAHWGKTPPCYPELIRAGVRRVCVAMRDPNPRVAGRGIRGLRRAGIRVSVGLCARDAAAQNRAFLTANRRGWPYVTLKAAMSLDGKTATRRGAAKWISSAASRRLGHLWRSRCDAILAGRGTIAADNPSLTAHGRGRNPLRIVLDPELRAPAASKIFRDGAAPTLVVAGPRPSTRRMAALRRPHVQVVMHPVRQGGFALKSLLKRLHRMGINHVLVEGGGETAWRFIKARCVDEFVFFVAPVVIGGRSAPTPVGGVGCAALSGALRVDRWAVTQVGRDVLLRGWVR